MATVNSAFYDTQKSDRTRPSVLAVPNTSDGAVQWARIPVSFAGTESAADVVRLCQLPPNCIPIPELSKVQCLTDPGTTLTVDVGTADNDDGWCDGENIAAVGLVQMGTAAVPAYSSAQTTLAADTGDDDGLTTVIATWRTVGTNTAATIIFYLAYKLGRGQ